ncbi:MAG: MarR family transcriptional regulator [Chitinophagales bacterium]
MIETEPQLLHIGRLFGKLTKLYIGFITKQLEDLPIERYFYVLLLIHKTEKPLTQKDLSEMLEIDKTSTVRLLDYLQENKMLKRKVKPDDRRSHYLVLTKLAENHIPEIEKAFEGVNEKLLQQVGKEEQEVFFNVFGKMICNLSQEPGDNIFLDFNKINISKASLKASLK